MRKSRGLFAMDVRVRTENRRNYEKWKQIFDQMNNCRVFAREISARIKKTELGTPTQLTNRISRWPGMNSWATATTRVV